MSLRIFSNGGGVQSTACLVLAAQGKIDFKTFLFCNVGDDSENPATLDYVHSVQMPYATAHGIELIELQKKMRDGSVETLAGRIYRTKRSIPIPVRLSNGAPGHRDCTNDFKIRPVARWLKDQGATVSGPAIVGLGISLDEFQRARTESGFAWQKLEYPLIDLRMTRANCMSIIHTEGLPIPPKSSCYFCPFHSPSEWMRIKRETPELFQRAIDIERKINSKHSSKDGYYHLHPYLIPLEKLEGVQTEFKFDEMGICESGYCMV